MLPARSVEEPTPSTALIAELQVFGTPAAGSRIASEVVPYPIDACKGCLLVYPPESAEPGPPNCRNVEGVSQLEAPCRVGQDDPVDCRLCRQTVPVASRGDCEPI